jgi:hypothetical protein
LSFKEKRVLLKTFINLRARRMNFNYAWLGKDILSNNLMMIFENILLYNVRERRSTKEEYYIKFGPEQENKHFLGL